MSTPPSTYWWFWQMNRLLNNRIPIHFVASAASDLTLTQGAALLEGLGVSHKLVRYPDPVTLHQIVEAVLYETAGRILKRYALEAVRDGAK